MVTQVNHALTYDSQKSSGFSADTNHKFGSRIFHSSYSKSWKFFQKRYTTRKIWSNWFATLSTSNKFVDGRSYSEVEKNNTAKKAIVTTPSDKVHSTCCYIGRFPLKKPQQSHNTPKVSKKKVVRPPSQPIPCSHSHIGHSAVPIMANRFQVLSNQSMLDDPLQLRVGNDTVDVAFTEDNIHLAKPKPSSKLPKNHKSNIFEVSPLNKVNENPLSTVDLHMYPQMPATTVLVDQKQPLNIIPSQDTINDPNDSITLYILQQKNQCLDFLKCQQQNGQEFGFFPMNSLNVYTGTSTANDNISDTVTLHQIVRSSGLPNYLGCRFPLQTQLNISAWRYHLQDYYDSQVLDLLEFGFPLDFDRSRSLRSTEVNHTYALQFQDHIENYLHEEISLGAIHGLLILNHSQCMCRLL